MRPGPKLKQYDRRTLRRIVQLIEKREMGLKAIARKFHTHLVVLKRNLVVYYGEELWERILQEYRDCKGFQKGTKIGEYYWYQKGYLRGASARRWRPIGSTTIRKVRYGPRRKKQKSRRYIKINDIPFKNYGTNWIFFARYLWEKNNGPIPKGMWIVHLDGNTLNDDLENLSCMKRGDYLRYLDRRFPKKLMQRRQRLSRAMKKRHQIRCDRVRVVQIRECASCSFVTELGRCPKCGSMSFEKIKVRTDGGVDKGKK